MTERRRPPRTPRPRATKPAPPPDEEAQLSEDEVQRRIETRGGGAGPARPPMEHALRDRRPTPTPRRADRGGNAQNALLLVGLAIVGLVAISILLPRGPLTSSASRAPSAASSATTAALAPSIASVAPSVGSSVVITLPPASPGPSEPAGPVATEAPTATPEVTIQPGPTPTRAPGATPRVTPRPSAAVTNPPPTAPPPTAQPSKLLVKIVVIGDNGGSAPPTTWTMTVNSAGSESPASFPGSTAGTLVTISPNLGYTVSSSGPAGFTETASANCASSTGGLPVPGATETCTITRNDIAPAVEVIVDVNGGPASASDWTVTVVATDASPSTFSGSAAGTTTRFDANKSFSISIANPSGGDYDQSQAGSCSGGGLALAATATCTFTLTYDPPATDPPPSDPPPSDPPLPGPIPGAATLLLPALLPARRGRAWSPTQKRA